MPKSDATIETEVERIYFEDTNLNNCPIDGMTLYDRRDDNDYTIRKIGDICWMTQNLMISGVISTEDSNFTTPDTFNVSQLIY